MITDILSFADFLFEALADIEDYERSLPDHPELQRLIAAHKKSARDLLTFLDTRDLLTAAERRAEGDLAN
jgi:hypothetical protein